MNVKNFATTLLVDHFRWLAGGVAVVVLLLGYLLLISPKWTEVSGATVSQRSTAEADLRSQTEYAQLLDSSIAKFQQALPATDRQKINSFLPSESDFPGLLLTIKNIVATGGLTLDNITIGESGQVVASNPVAANTSNSGLSASGKTANAATAAGINVKTQDVVITVSGGTTYEVFKNLLLVIESSQRLFDVISVGYAPATMTGEKTTNNTWSLTLRTYYLPNK